MTRKNILSGKTLCPVFAVDLEDGRRLHAYKHYWTRRYLHLDSEGRAFTYMWDERDENDDGRYEEVNPVWILDLVLQGNSELRGDQSGPEPLHLRS
jgi:hypothetical protein